MAGDGTAAEGDRVADAARLARGRLSLPWRRQGGVPRTVLVELDGRAHQVVLSSRDRDAAARGGGR